MTFKNTYHIMDGLRLSKYSDHFMSDVSHELVEVLGAKVFSSDSSPA